MMKPIHIAALAGALLWGACSKEPAPAQQPAPSPEPVARATPDAEPDAEPQAEQEAPASPAQPGAAPAVKRGEPPEFTVGQSRDEVMRLFAGCAERRVFLPAGPNSLYVEIYQAREDEACRKYLGERHFTIRGGVLHQITPGRMPPPSYEPPPDNI